MFYSVVVVVGMGVFLGGRGVGGGGACFGLVFFLGGGRLLVLFVVFFVLLFFGVFLGGGGVCLYSISTPFWTNYLKTSKGL